MSSLVSWREQFLNILSTISDPWNCHIEFPNTIDVFLKKKIIFGLPYPCMENYQVWRSCIPRVYVSISYHNWPIFLFLLTILWNSQSGRKKIRLSFLFSIASSPTYYYTFRPFHIFIFRPPWAKLAKKWEIVYLNIRKGVANFFSDSDTYHTISTYVKTLATT